MLRENSLSKLCTVAIICCLVVTPAFSEDTYSEKSIKKSIKKEVVENLTQEYVDNVNNYLSKQAFENSEYKKALKTADYYIQINKKYHGDTSINVGYAYLAKADVSLMVGDITTAIKAIDAAKQIAMLHPDEKEILNLINIMNEHRYGEAEQTLKAAEYATLINEDANKKEIKKLIYLSQSGDTKNVLKALNKMENKATKAKNNCLLADIYEQKIDTYREINNYKEMWKYIEKAEKLTTEFPQLKNSISNAKISYYKGIGEFDKAKEILDKEISAETTNDELNYYGILYDIEKTANNYKEAYKCVKFIENFHKDNYPENSLRFTKVVYDKWIDLYKDLNETDKVKEYLDAFKVIAVQTKDASPIIYAKYLEKEGNFQAYSQNFVKAKETLKKSAEIYEKLEPKSRSLANLYSYISSSERNSGNLDKAIEYINKAIAHNTKYHSDTNKDLADFYKDLAYLYLEKGDFVKGKIYLNKCITLYKIIYGDNCVKTLQKELELYNVFKDYNKHQEANDLLANINQIAYSDKLIGSSKSFSYNIAIINATIAIENQNYEKALDYLKEAKEVANTKCKKARIKQLKYNIYKENGNKIKALRFKKFEELD